MAVTARAGSDGTSLILGRQSEYGTRVTTNNAPTTTVPGMIQKAFPCSSLEVGEDADVQESDLITALGADTPDEIGQFWSTFNFTTRVLIEDIFHFLRGMFNPTTVTSTPLPGTDALAQVSGNPPTTAITTFDQAIAQHGALTTPLTLPAANWTGQLQLALGGTPTYAADATMVIEGYRGIGRPNADRFFARETVPLSASSLTSTNFWREITSVTITGVTGATNYALQWVPDTHITSFGFSANDPQFPGWTMMPVQGGAPGVAQDAIPNTFTLNATPSGVNVTVEGLASRYDELRTIEGLDTEQLLIPAADYAAHFGTADLRSYAGWSGAFQFGDDIVKYTNIDIAINRNYQPEEGVDGSRFRRGVESTRTRQVTFTPTTRFQSGDMATDMFTRWQEVFRNQTEQELTMRLYAFDNDGRQNRFDILSDNSQLNASPRISVGGPGPIDRPLSFKAIPVAGTSDSEIVFRVYTENAYTEA